MIYIIRKNKMFFFYLLTLIFLCTFGYNLFLIYNNDSFPTTAGLSYSCYLIYFFGGYLVNNVTIKDRAYSLFWGLIVFSLSIFCCALTMIKFDYFLWYDNIFILFASISVFVIFKSLFPYDFNCKKLLVGNLITQLSNMIFGVFLIHMLFLRLLLPLLPLNVNILNGWLLYYALIGMTYLLSCLTVLIVSIISREVAYLIFRYK